jgi:hypothetical protein
MTEATFSDSENPCYGLDTARDPSALPAGYYATLDNIALGDDGVPRTRPGFQGVSTSALGLEIGEAIGVVRNDSGFAGEKWALLVAGGTSNADIYSHKKDAAAAPTLLSGSLDFDRRKTQFCTFGEWILISGCTDGRLYRFKFPSTFEACSTGGTSPAALIQPTKKMSATLTNRVLDALNVQAEWERDTVSSSISIPDNNFAGSVEDDPVASPGALSPDWDVIDSGDPTLLFARLDGSNDSIITNDYFDNDVVANSNGIGDVTRYTVHHQLTYRLRATNAAQRIEATLFIYDSSNNLKASQSAIIAPTQTADAENGSVYFTFAGLVDPTLAVKCKLQLAATSANTGSGSPGTVGPYISQMQVAGFTEGMQAATVSGSTTISVVPDHVPTDTLYIGEMRFSYDLSAQTDFDLVDRVLVPYTEILTPVNPYSIRLGLRTATNDAAAISAPGYTLTDGGITFLVFDLSGLSSTDRQNIEFVELIFGGNVNLIDTIESRSSPTDLFTIGAVVAPGGLTPESTYTYLYRERNGTSLIYSPALATPSNSITPSTLKATASVTIEGPSGFPANASAQIQIFRSGGPLFGDGLFRLVATVPSGSSSGSLEADGYSWDSANRVFIDALDDGRLFFADVLHDHDTPPFGSGEPILAINALGPRAVAVTAKAVYASQISDNNNAAAIYWESGVNDPDSVFAELDGWNKKLQHATGTTLDSNLGQVPRLTPFRGWLVCHYPGSLYVLTGDKPPFQFTRYNGDESRGAVSHRAIQIVNNKIEWLATDGVRSWDGTGLEQFGASSIRYASTRLNRLLNPAGSFLGTTLPAAVSASSSMLSTMGRSYLFTAKDSNSSTTDAIYCADWRFGTPDGDARYFRWLKSIRGGFVFPGDDVWYAFDASGRIFKVGPSYGDKNLVGDSLSGVAQVLETRGFGDGKSLWRGQRWYAVAECADSPGASVTFSEIGADATANTYAVAYTLNTSGETIIRRQKIASRVEGRALRQKVEATTSSPLIVRELGMTATPIRPLR